MLKVIPTQHNVYRGFQIPQMNCKRSTHYAVEICGVRLDGSIQVKTRRDGRVESLTSVGGCGVMGYDVDWLIARNATN